MVALAILLPVGIAAALNARIPIAINEVSLAPIGPAAPPEAALDAADRWQGAELNCRVWPATSERATLVELSAAEDLALPDVLIYWSATEGEGTSLAGDEFLIGSFFGKRTQRFALPAAAHSGVDGPTGKLILYSLAHNRVVASASIAGLVN